MALIRFLIEPGVLIWFYHLAPYVGYAALAAALGCALAYLYGRPRRRRPARIAVVVLLLVAVFAFAVRYGARARIGVGRSQAMEAMLERPHDPWPRGSGHVPLGPFGSEAKDKGYLEPGGSFSPAFDTFGVSFWVVDSSGTLITTSDDIPLAETDARYISSPDGSSAAGTSPTDAPGIVVETPYYMATWTATGSGRYRLSLISHTAADRHVEISLRGVGPSAGPLSNIAVDRGEIRINDGWTVGPVSPAEITFLGNEGDAGWTRPSPVHTSTSSNRAGWASVRFAPPPVATLTFASPRNSSSDAGSANAPALPEPQPGPVLRGGDPVFDRALQAQIMTLELGLVGHETRPGEPIQYPLQWLRDGAFAIVALARAGQTDWSQMLDESMAKNDFFGGFGAEADGPGLALWTLAQTSALIHRPDFDQHVWPDVKRKVQLIEEMLAATAPIEHDYSGPIVPRHRHRKDLKLVADPARDGLINGKMDWHRPIFYINAMTYAGLVGAGDMAERLGHAPEAAAWRAIAAQLQRDYRRAFTKPDWSDQVENDRTAISGLWPADIAQRDEYAALLNRRWTQSGGDSGMSAPRALYTYFTVGEAHQWLRLGWNDRVWSTLESLWSYQTTPGLYTLWEGSGEENYFPLWRQTRGWIKPPNNTPHYWATAEMVLLQLAMLAETRVGPTGEELVIGSGVPAAWLSHDVSVSRIGTGAGFVDWAWNGSVAVVTIHGGPAPPAKAPTVRLGPAFPAAASLIVQNAAE